MGGMDGVEEQETGVMGAEFHPDLFTGGRERAVLSRCQKRLQRCEHAATTQDGRKEHELDQLSATELKALQENDAIPILSAVRQAVDGEPSIAGPGFFRRDGVIYQRWTPPGRDGETMEVT